MISLEKSQALSFAKAAEKTSTKFVHIDDRLEQNCTNLNIVQIIDKYWENIGKYFANFGQILEN